MKKFSFLLATILALASTTAADASGVGFARSRVVVRPAVSVQAFVVRPAFVGFRQQVVVQQAYSTQAFVQPFYAQQVVQQVVAQPVVADYGVQQIVQPVQVQVQAIAVQPLILRSRVVRFVGY